MKSVLMSIQPKWCKLIADGKKTVEVRKTKPKLETPFKVYIYATKQREFLRFRIKGSLCVAKPITGKAIGEFVCEKIDRIEKRGIPNNFDYCYLSLNEWGNDDIEIEITDIKKSCISKKELNLYGEKTNCLYAWHISDLVIYDKPKELGEFFVYCDRCDKRPIACKFAYEESNENGYYSECMCDFKRPIERPPQSWCYVEEKE